MNAASAAMRVESSTHDGLAGPGTMKKITGSPEQTQNEVAGMR
jgi:hypothetical protein